MKSLALNLCSYFPLTAVTLDATGISSSSVLDIVLLLPLRLQIATESTWLVSKRPSLAALSGDSQQCSYTLVTPSQSQVESNLFIKCF